MPPVSFRTTSPTNSNLNQQKNPLISSKRSTHSNSNATIPGLFKNNDINEATIFPKATLDKEIGLYDGPSYKPLPKTHEPRKLSPEELGIVKTIADLGKEALETKKATNAERHHGDQL